MQLRSSDPVRIVRAPVATSSTAICVCRGSSRTPGTTAQAIRAPSGDQAGYLDPVRRRQPLRLTAAGRDEVDVVDVVQVPVRAAIGRNAIRAPSGDHAGPS